jgi:hypothetical protein
MAKAKPQRAHHEDQKKSADTGKEIITECAQPEQSDADTESTETPTEATTETPTEPTEETLLQLIPGAFLTSLGLHLEEKLTFEGALAIAERLGSIGKGTAWTWGDLALHVERLFSTSYGVFKKLAEKLGVADQTLYNYKSVAKRFPRGAPGTVSRRREGLDFGHHAEVQGLTPKTADKLLAQAEAEKWTVIALRLKAAPFKKPKKTKPKPDDTKDDKKPDDDTTIKDDKKPDDGGGADETTKDDDKGGGTGNDTGGGNEDTNEGEGGTDPDKPKPNIQEETQATVEALVGAAFRMRANLIQTPSDDPEVLARLQEACTIITLLETKTRRAA